MTEPERPLLPGQSSPPEEPDDTGRRIALGLTAGAGLIAVAVVAGVLLVVGALVTAQWLITHLI